MPIFDKKEKLNGLPALTVKEGFIVARLRESRNQTDQLTFLGEKARREIILGLPVINVKPGKQEVL